MKIVIFDIDGTLADLSHRLHFVKGGKRDWDAFFDACPDDRPIWPMIDLLNVLGNEHSIILVSGRSEKIRKETEKWLYEHRIFYRVLFLRPEGDYRKDFIIKKEILAQIRKDYPDDEIAFVVDDRPSVVKMWREEGLICLQCAEWEEESVRPSVAKGLLTLMIGPSGAGKSSLLDDQVIKNYKDNIGLDLNMHTSQVVSSDRIRHELCGNFRDQTKNVEVFAALKAVVLARINSGLPTVIDATNIKRADRLGMVELAAGSAVRYIVIDRPLEEKRRDAGWRAELLVSGVDLIATHHQTFQSQLKNILSGDGLPNVQVIDLRKV